jgi:hypothetical protein
MTGRLNKLSHLSKFKSGNCSVANICATFRFRNFFRYFFLKKVSIAGLVYFYKMKVESAG